MTTEDARQENIRVGAAARRAVEALTEPGWVTTAPVSLTRRRVVLDLVPIARYPQSGGSAMYARSTEDGEEGTVGLPIIYLTPEDFRALGEREQITITIEPGDVLDLARDGAPIPAQDGTTDE